GYGYVPWLGEVHQALAPVIDKTHLGAFRVLHFLALAYLAYILAGEGGRHLSGALVREASRVGRQTLPVFLSGLVLAQALGAALEPGRRWPVLYLFHGLNGTERDWAEAGRAKETLDRLIEARRIEPLLVVMPMAGNGWYVDNPDPGGAGRLAEAFAGDLVDHVDASLPTAACRAARGAGGLSMGGYGALLYAMDHPDRYAAAFSLSGSVFQ